MSAVQILPNVSRERLPEALPHIYRSACDKSRLREAIYTVLVFPSTKVVLSTIVSRALTEVPADAHVLAFAHNLTAEGLAFLADRSAIVFLIHGAFHWTDETYRSVA